MVSYVKLQLNLEINCRMKTPVLITLEYRQIRVQNKWQKVAFGFVFFSYLPDRNPWLSTNRSFEYSKSHSVNGGSRIFHRVVPAPEGLVLSYCLAQFLPKTTWKWKFDREGWGVPSTLLWIRHCSVKKMGWKFAKTRIASVGALEQLTSIRRCQLYFPCDALVISTSIGDTLY